jgi:hypothetical protein
MQVSFLKKLSLFCIFFYGPLFWVLSIQVSRSFYDFMKCLPCFAFSKHENGDFSILKKYFIHLISPNLVKYTYGWLPFEQHH